MAKTVPTLSSPLLTEKHKLDDTEFVAPIQSLYNRSPSACFRLLS
jgi:hypothetical protein